MFILGKFTCTISSPPPFVDKVFSEERVKKDNEMSGNVPGGNFPGENFPGESLMGGNFLGENFPGGGGNFPGGNFPDGNFPRTVFNREMQNFTVVPRRPFVFYFSKMQNFECCTQTVIRFLIKKYRILKVVPQCVYPSGYSFF